jgi:hypothetical protein
VNSKEENSLDLCPDFVQEFGLCSNSYVPLENSTRISGGCRGDFCLDFVQEFGLCSNSYVPVENSTRISGGCRGDFCLNVVQEFGLCSNSYVPLEHSTRSSGDRHSLVIFPMSTPESQFRHFYNN